MTLVSTIIHALTHTYQVMGDELLHILENQRQLEQKFEQLMETGGGGADLRDEAHSLATSTHGSAIELGYVLVASQNQQIVFTVITYFPK